MRIEKKRFNRSGFSLFELLIVIAIIAIILALFLSALGHKKQREDAEKANAELRMKADLIQTTFTYGLIDGLQHVELGHGWYFFRGSPDRDIVSRLSMFMGENQNSNHFVVTTLCPAVIKYSECSSRIDPMLGTLSTRAGLTNGYFVFLSNIQTSGTTQAEADVSHN